MTSNKIKESVLQAIKLKVEVKHIKHLNPIGTKSLYIMCLGMDTINIYTYINAIGDIEIDGLDYNDTNIMYREEFGYHVLSNYIIESIEKQRNKSGKALMWTILLTITLALIFRK